MKLKLKTELLQTMVSKAIKGSSNNTGLYITQLLGMKLSNNELTMTTTDGSNYLYITEEKVAGDDFEVVLPVEKFAKLVSKLTCEDVTIELTKPKKGQAATMVVHGNGKYVIELPYDEDGQLVEFPDPMSDLPDEMEQADLKKGVVSLILGTAKHSLLVSGDDSCYRGYYCGDKIIATDSLKICGIDIKIFDEPKLISPETMNLLELMSGEEIEVNYSDDVIVYGDDRVQIYSKVMEGIDDFKYDAISTLLEEKFASSCQLDKTQVLQALDRLSLFVEMYDKNGIYLTFTKDGLKIDNKTENGNELVPYKQSSKFKDFTCCIDIEMFRSQIKATPTDLITLYYGKDTSIKFEDDNTIQIVGLAEDDRVEDEEDEIMNEPEDDE